MKNEVLKIQINSKHVCNQQLYTSETLPLNTVADKTVKTLEKEHPILFLIPHNHPTKEGILLC